MFKEINKLKFIILLAKEVDVSDDASIDLPSTSERNENPKKKEKKRKERLTMRPPRMDKRRAQISICARVRNNEKEKKEQKRIETHHFSMSEDSRET
jgi:hypothetical protein